VRRCGPVLFFSIKGLAASCCEDDDEPVGFHKIWKLLALLQDYNIKKEILRGFS
jgi:hypothetical protein